MRHAAHMTTTLNTESAKRIAEPITLKGCACVNYTQPYIEHGRTQKSVQMATATVADFLCNAVPYKREERLHTGGHVAFVSEPNCCDMWCMTSEQTTSKNLKQVNFNRLYHKHEIHTTRPTFPFRMALIATSYGFRFQEEEQHPML